MRGEGKGEEERGKEKGGRGKGTGKREGGNWESGKGREERRTESKGKRKKEKKDFRGIVQTAAVSAQQADGVVRSQALLHPPLTVSALMKLF